MNLDMRAAMLGQAVRAYLAGRGAKKEPVAYLYGHVAKEGETPTHTINGVDYVGAVLPKLPEWDRETYPYAVILNPWNLSWHYLIFSADVPYISKTTGDKTIYFPGAVIIIASKDSNTIWNTENATEHTYGGGYVFGSTLWSNTDLYTIEGTLYLAESNPVPVYE